MEAKVKIERSISVMIIESFNSFLFVAEDINLRGSLFIFRQSPWLSVLFYFLCLVKNSKQFSRTISGTD